MDSWISDTRPLLSLVFRFLTPSDQQRWRLSGLFAQHSSDMHNAPMKWRDVVLNQSMVEMCPICSRIHLVNTMFYCLVCRQYICGNHIVSCNVCMFELCEKCARNKQCIRC